MQENSSFFLAARERVPTPAQTAGHHYLNWDVRQASYIGFHCKPPL
jgi:hypothetical protein